MDRIENRIFDELRTAARVPIILICRADMTLARPASCAIALLLARHTVEVKS